MALRINISYFPLQHILICLRHENSVCSTGELNLYIQFILLNVTHQLMHFQYNNIIIIILKVY